jgi:Ser-tRNA(Ala) deacylase AlaX
MQRAISCRVQCISYFIAIIPKNGGTHVMNTSEVGKIKVIDYKSKGAINKRIYIEIE